MSWTDAGRHHRLLREIEAALDLAPATAPATAPPWRPEWAEVFGTPDRLRSALLTRWRTVVEAQTQDFSTAEIAAAHPGLAGLAGVTRRVGPASPAVVPDRHVAGRRRFCGRLVAAS